MKGSEIMFEFIICSYDNDEIEEINEVIHSTMFNYKYEYKIQSFDIYNINFQNIIENTSKNRIYIIRMGLKNKDFIDLARKIRANDIESSIIYIGITNEVIEDIFKYHLMLFDFIDIFNNDISDRLKKSISYLIENNYQNRFIKFIERNVTYVISTKDILYITTIPCTRKSLIVTIHSEITISKSLREIKELLDDDFMYSHRACIVNINKIQSVNFKEHIITFENGKTVELLSNRSTKNIINKIRY